VSLPRPRFTEREGRLLLSAVYRALKQEPKDADWMRLYGKLDRLYGNGAARRGEA
jgi:hypothetical protein